MGLSIQLRSGSSIGVDDFVIPEEKPSIIDAAEKEVKSIESQYESGLVTQGERYNKVIDIWSRANEKVAKAMMTKISTDQVIDSEGKELIKLHLILYLYMQILVLEAHLLRLDSFLE